MYVSGESSVSSESVEGWGGGGTGVISWGPPNFFLEKVPQEVFKINFFLYLSGLQLHAVSFYFASHCIV